MSSATSPKTDNIYHWIKKVISSKKFFYAIIILAIIQGLWYAIIFQPNIFDEGFHINAIFFYLSHLNPFNIGIQEMRWDVNGEMVRNVSYVFYYFMGLPLRLIMLITNNFTLQVIGLRLIMIGFFAAGLAMYRKALFLAGFSALIINIALISTILLPNIAPLAGAVNYDIVIFFLFPTGLYFAIKIIKYSRLNAVWCMALLVIIIMALLVKFTTALALFSPVVGYLIYDLWKKYHSKIVLKFIESFQNSKKFIQIALILTLILGTGLLIERPVMNYVVYHSDSPPCDKILSKERCMSYYTYKRGVDFRNAKPFGWRPSDPFEYLSTYWVTGMINTNIRMPDKSALPAMKIIFYAAAVFGSLLILINLQSLLKKKQIKLLIIGSVFFTAALFYSNYTAYVRLGQPVAISGRYLLPYLPIFGVLALASFSQIFNNKIKKVTISVFLPIILLLMAQGGGITTLILDQETYWNGNDFSRSLNEGAKKNNPTPN